MRTPCSRRLFTRLRTACATWLLPLLLLTPPAALQAQFTFVTNNGTITITGYTGTNAAVTIPSTITGLPVRSIGDYAFVGCSSLTSVTIGTNVTSIRDYAFDNCSSLTSVTIGTNVTSIGDDAFRSCGSLTAITIPNSVTSIGNGAFAGCGSLTTITVDTRNPVYSDVDGVLFDQSQTRLVAYPGGKAGGYAIPDTVSSIGDFAFFLCTSLTRVTLGTNVTSIGEAAFDCCASLTAITIPNSVSSMGLNVFSGCTSLINATIDSVASIEEGMFSGCTGLTKVTIPDSVTSIEQSAFIGCTGLTAVTIGSGVTSFGDEVFWGCTSLTNVAIPESVASIGGAVFYNCTNLTGVFFRGNPPSSGDWLMFLNDNYVTVYYLPGTTGWGTTYKGRPALLWNPQPLSVALQTNQFGFTITGTTNIPVVVEACTNLASAHWTALQTCTLTNGSIYFPDPGWRNYHARFYRIRSP